MNIFPNLNKDWKQKDEKKFMEIYQDTSLEELMNIFNRPEEEIILMAVHARKKLIDQQEQQRLMKEEGIEYDRRGYMKFNPSFHDRQGQPWTDEEREYLCKYHDVDGREAVSMALGRTIATVASMVGNLKRAGLYEWYKNQNRHYV
jgi:hypothetical protein